MTILDTIIAQTQADLQLQKNRVPESLLQAQAEAQRPSRSLAAALRRRAAEPPNVIAELKKASPSKGTIRPDFAPVNLARELADSGAAALSVLTEPHWFGGSSQYLRQASAAVALPILRKDFIVDSYQVLEARAWGADAILLIAAALDDHTYARLAKLASALGLGVLTEIHDHAELTRMLALGAEVIGVNSRDLKTFHVNLDVSESLLAEIPNTCVKIAESGIGTGADMQRLCRAGADAFLIGETLMRAKHPGQALRALLAESDTRTKAGRP